RDSPRSVPTPFPIGQGTTTTRQSARPDPHPPHHCNALLPEPDVVRTMRLRLDAPGGQPVFPTVPDRMAGSPGAVAAGPRAAITVTAQADALGIPGLRGNVLAVAILHGEPSSCATISGCARRWITPTATGPGAPDAAPPYSRLLETLQARGQGL